MHLNYIKQDALKTGNSEIDTKIDFLLQAIGYNLNYILDEKWGINCNKIDLAIKENTYQLNPPTLIEVKKILTQVREILQKNFNISYELRHVDSIQEGEKTISNYNHIPLSIISFNTLLWRCNGLTQAEEIITKYAQTLTFNFHTYTTLYKVLLQDNQRPTKDIKNILNTILTKINSYGKLDGKSKWFLIAMLNTAQNDIKKFIQDTIYRKELSFLEEIVKKPTSTSIQDNSNKYHSPSIKEEKNIQKKPEPDTFEKKLSEARAAGLGELAYLYASWQLSSEIGWWGKWHRKNGSTFGKWQKEM